MIRSVTRRRFPAIDESRRRSVTTPARALSGVSRMGVVQAGDGGSASAYQFDGTGLSKDTRLAYYLQDLTPSQLQVALNGQSPNADLIQQLQDEQAGTGASWLPCGTAESGDPYCNGGQPQSGSGFLSSLSSIPTWAWIAGGGTIAALLLIPRR